MTSPPCPLCHGFDTAHYATAADRDHLRCAQCTLIYAHPDSHLPAEQESHRYRQHRNSPDDPAYVDFLRRLATPVSEQVPVGSNGLDYGCGPAPVLGQILTESGRPTLSYDPLFFPDRAVLDRRYDFVTCSEVVEHAHSPRRLFGELAACVRPGGTLGVMTRFYQPQQVRFEDWWYQRDPTHVAFYGVETMQWIAGHFGWTLTLPMDNVALFMTADRPDGGFRTDHCKRLPPE